MIARARDPVTMMLTAAGSSRSRGAGNGRRCLRLGLILLTMLPSAVQFSAFATATGVPPMGYENCRCATESELPPASERAEQLKKFDSTIADPETYGIGCAAHDMSRDVCKAPPPPEEMCDNVVPVLPECTAAGVPTWCPRSWCYVTNTSLCTVAHEISPDLGSPYMYSYATCGELDAFSGDDASLGILSKKTLRVGMRHNTGGWKGVYHPDGKQPLQRDELWFGPTFELLKTMGEKAGFFMNYTEAPQWVYDQAESSSIFTECVYATGLGYLDFCLSMFTITPERLDMSSFFTLTTEPMYLLVRDESESTGQKIAKVLKPFEGGVWSVVLFLLILLPLIITCQDVVQAYLCGERKSLKPNATEASMSIYLGLRSFTDQAVSQDTSSWGARVTALGMGMFLLLTLAMYTANLTNILVASAAGPAFNDIEDALESGAVICIEYMMVQPMKNKFPSAKLAIDEDYGQEGLMSRTKIIPYIEAGKCDVAVVNYEDVVWQHGLGNACDMRIVGMPIFYQYIGFPMFEAPELSALRSMTQALINQGVWDSILKANEPKPMCGSNAAEIEASLSFSIAEMSGILILTTILTLIGLSATVFDLLRHKLVKSLLTKEEADLGTKAQRRIVFQRLREKANGVLQRAWKYIQPAVERVKNHAITVRVLAALKKPKSPPPPSSSASDSTGCTSSEPSESDKRKQSQGITVSISSPSINGDIPTHQIPDVLDL